MQIIRLSSISDKFQTIVMLSIDTSFLLKKLFSGPNLSKNILTLNEYVVMTNITVSLLFRTVHILFHTHIMPNFILFLFHIHRLYRRT